MPELDVIAVGYKSGEDWACLQRDLPAMTESHFDLWYFDNTGNPKTLTIAWNDLGRRGNAEYLAFLNTDIRISPGWDRRLMEAFDKREDIGCTLPRPIGHGWPTLIDKSKPRYQNPVNAPAPGPQDMASIATMMSNHEGLEHFDECNAAFYTVMIRRKHWEDLKGFDERLRFYGQDHDFQRRMKSRFDLKTMRVNRCPVWHRCNGSVNKARGEVNFTSELKHLGRTTEALKNGSLPEWDRLSDQERQAVRTDPVYGKMPR